MTFPVWVVVHFFVLETDFRNTAQILSARPFEKKYGTRKKSKVIPNTEKIKKSVRRNGSRASHLTGRSTGKGIQ
jgi:hypothetical protein